MGRILSVWLPSWPILRLRRSGTEAGGKPFAPAAERPFAIIETRHGVRLLAAVDPAAEAAGLHPGQALTQARAICPELTLAEADPAADRVALTALADWCTRFTPLVAADPPDGLWLDIAGCTHPYGDEAGLLAAIDARLTRDLPGCRMALADTPTAAWAMARAVTRDSGAILSRGTELRALATLPVGLLRLDQRVVAGLRRVGLKTVGELVRMPRAELSARFGAAPVLRLEQAAGRASEAIAWRQPPAEWQAFFSVAEPISTPEDLARALAALADTLCTRLAAAQQGAHRFVARFIRTDGQSPQIEIATAMPVHDPRYVAKLLGEKLDSVDPGLGVEAMMLDGIDIAPVRLRQVTLSDRQQAQHDLAHTLDTLANRIGGENLWREAPHPSHIPERATERLPPLGLPPLAPAAIWDQAAERPLRLLPHPEPITTTALLPDDPPIQFTWRGALHRIRAASGPERISAEWWRDPKDTQPDRQRDYYRLEDHAGARFWVFREGMGTATWFMHGMFA